MSRSKAVAKGIAQGAGPAARPAGSADDAATVVVELPDVEQPHVELPDLGRPDVIDLTDPTAVTALAGKQVLVVGINYAPEPTGIAPYTTGVAEHLAKYADRVTVFAGLPHYPSWQVPDSHRRRRRIIEPSEAGRPRVIRLAHYVPRRQGAVRRAVYELTFLLHVLWAARRLPRRPDLIVCATPALGGAVAAARLAHRLDVPLVTIVQDLMSKAAGQSGIGGGASVVSLTARLERYALRSATRVAVVADAFRTVVEAFGVMPDRIDLLANWAHVGPSALARDEARAALGWSATAFIAAHTGNIGLKQDLGNVVEAARLVGSRDQQVLVIGEGSQRAAIAEQASGLEWVRLLPPLDAEQYPLALAAADVLLVNERAGVIDRSLPSKLTSYLAAGRPVLAAVNSDGATAAELESTDGAALVVPAGDPRALADALQELRGDPGRRLTMALAARGYARERLTAVRSMTQLATTVTAAAPVTPRDLRAFRPDGYVKGRGKAWQLAWFVTMNLVFRAWWCPARLRPVILRAFGAQVGRRVLIRHRVRVLWPWKLRIGSDCWIGEDAWLLNLEPITIEDDVCLSQGAMLCAGSHDRRDPAFRYDNAPIHVGTGAWVAARAMVLRGSTVPAGGVVPAGETFRATRGTSSASSASSASPAPQSTASGEFSVGAPEAAQRKSPLAGVAPRVSPES